MSRPSRRVASVVLLLLVPSAAAAQTAALPDSTPPTHIVLPGVVTVPLLRGRDSSSRPLVAVMVNGHGPFNFLIETGAREIDLSPGLIDTLGLKRIGGSDEQPEYRLDSINVGAAAFHGVNVAAEPAGVAALGIAGVLGLPFYQNVLLTIDYPAREVRFANDSLPAANGADILALSRVDAFWGMPITIAGRPFTGVLDTQSSGGINIPPALGDSLPFKGGLVAVGRARGAFGTVDIKGGILDGDIAIGRYTFPTPFLIGVPLPPDFPGRPNIGTRVFENFVVTLDQRHGRLRLAREGSTTIALPVPRRSGGSGGL
ncbi:MAG TPA: retropepsin-like aspartic protease [Gemmatimonadales bacterium]|jgi:hypothetical protein|nr:retropepsin-like aspartic protease [Gemmatimonadales bacterium]